MPTERRSGLPYIHVTWLAGLLSGDKHCRWASWFKSRHDYDRRPSDGDLRRWKADHARMVNDRVAELSRGGWTVYVEGQNKFKIKGRTAILAGGPDIVAARADTAVVEDCKTGQPRDSDQWQVVLYMLFLRQSHDGISDRPLRGAVIYRSGDVVKIGADEAGATELERVLAQIAETVGEVEPLRVPSAGECFRCDIACCPDRVAETKQVETEAF